MKYKVGDRVVVARPESDYARHKGRVGKITELWPGNVHLVPYSYHVAIGEAESFWASEDELDPAESAGEEGPVFSKEELAYLVAGLNTLETLAVQDFGAKRLSIEKTLDYMTKIRALRDKVLERVPPE